MEPLKAQVINGRLVLDVPTDLPEGEVVLLTPVDPVARADDFSEEEREELHNALDEGIEAALADDDIDADEVEPALGNPPT